MALSETVGSYSEFNYTGDMQSVTIPADGIYKLECYGAQGGTTTHVWASGGNGGYSCGYKELKKGDILYVCVGGAGGVVQRTQGTTSYSYNGGGYGRTSDGECGAGSGGGATHIATVTGVLSSLSAKKDKIILVAGGGGGAAFSSNYYNAGGWDGNSSSGNGVFGQGSSVEGRGSGAAGGGGGGYYGGTSRYSPLNTALSGGGGGTGYTDGAPKFSFNGTTYAPSMSSGVRSGNGYAKITFVALSKIYNLNVDGSVVQTVYLDGVALEQIKFDGVSVFGNP